MGPLRNVLILVQRPKHKSTSDSVEAPKPNHFGAIFIEFGDTKKCHTFGGLELVPKRELAVSAACTKVKNAFNSFGTIRKNCFCCKLQRIRDMYDLYGKKGILRHTQRLKKVLHVVRCAKNAPQRLKKYPNPSGL